VIEAVDALHDTSTLGDELWQRLSASFSDAQLLDLLMLSGWYHAISFAANAAQVEPETGRPGSPTCWADRRPPRGPPFVTVITAGRAYPERPSR